MSYELKETCDFCGKLLKVIVNVIPSKLDDKRYEFYQCPHCGEVLGKINVNGNELIDTEKCNH